MDVDELFRYVHRNVSVVAKQRFKRVQTPARIVGSAVRGVPVVIRPAPRTLKGLIDDMAEQIATAAQLEGVGRMGIPEFVADTRMGELLGGGFGVLGRWCAAYLEERLWARSADKFAVVEQQALEEVLRGKGLGVPDLRTSATRGLAVEGEGVAALVLGTLRNRVGRVITLQCRLVGTDDRKLYGIAGGSAALNESELLMLDGSADFPPPLAPSPNHPVPPSQFDLTSVRDRLVQGDHPLRNPHFRFPVKIMVNGEERKGEFLGNDYYIPFRKDDVFTIRVENRDGHVVPMQLFVDGRSTLPERGRAKGVRVEAAPPATLEAGRRVNFFEARPWVLDPERSAEFEVRGFCTEVGDNGKYREFLVADAPDSIGARQKYGQQLGMITAVFYTESGDRRGLNVIPGPERTQQIRLYHRPVALGGVLAVVQIRYVEAQAFEKLKRDRPSAPPM